MDKRERFAVAFKIGVRKAFAIFTGKHLRCGLLYRTPPVAASELIRVDDWL